ncbi:ScpA family protein [Caldanaerobacter subterraneus]|uniref:ScpA family protein n=1 Tax=Caldanaerobacter subterraneus TaxID=911092 RepID=UPI0034649487
MYTVKLEIFEGPFDLLFHLIEKNEIDLMDIPISIILDQYMEYIRSLQEMDLDVASEFIVMAATLVEIKSRMLLPKFRLEEEAEKIEEDPREELVKQLIEYKKYKEIAQLLSGICGINRRFFKEEPDLNYIDKRVALNYSVEDIANVYRKILERNKEKENKIEIKKEEYTVVSKIKELLTYLVKKPALWFSEIVRKSRSKLEVVVSFVALLELIKLNKVAAEQQTAYGDIFIRFLGREGRKHDPGRQD